VLNAFLDVPKACTESQRAVRLALDAGWRLI